MPYAIIHYDEIGLKGSNRPYFERVLSENIKTALGGDLLNVGREYGQSILSLKKGVKEAEIAKKLEIVPGIANFTFGERAKLSLAEINKMAVKIAKRSDAKTFKVDTKRHNKLFGKKSPEINAKAGEAVLEGMPKIKVRMKNPGLLITIEICNRHAYVSTKKHEGLGGLPVGTAGKVVSLVSGGLDSPVASFLMMKRGARCVLVHFRNKLQMEKSVQDKVERLAKTLAKVQGKTKLYIVPFEELQREIIANIPAEYRMLVYRRFMLRISEKVAGLEKAKALVVGDSLSQVASQTLDNIGAVYSSVKMPVLSPLMGMNKREVVDISKEIGTYETSILPYGDCCSYFVPKHPAIKASAEQLDRLESGLKIEELASRAFGGRTVRKL